jgi:hypothetical protein
MTRSYWEAKKAWLAGEAITEDEARLIGTAHVRRDASWVLPQVDSFGDERALNARERSLGRALDPPRPGRGPAIAARSAPEPRGKVGKRPYGSGRSSSSATGSA